jgi:flagellar protein FlaI
VRKIFSKNEQIVKDDKEGSIKPNQEKINEPHYDFLDKINIENKQKNSDVQNKKKNKLKKEKEWKNFNKKEGKSKKFEETQPQKILKYDWTKHAKANVKFNDELKEYVYEINEPILTEEEQKIKEKITRIFRVQTDVDIDDLNEINKSHLLKETLDQIIETHKIELNQELKDNIYYYIFREFLGYGKINVLMHDEEIEDISCDGKGIPVFVYHRKHESIRSNIIYETDEELNSFVIKLSQISGKQISIYEPIVDGKLPDGSRLQSTLAKTVTNSSTFTIRRFRSNPLTFIDLINYRALSLEMAAYFWLILEYGTSILFSGGTASGKTTMLNAMSLFIPAGYKIVSVEDTREINLPHENWIAGTVRSGFITSEKDKSAKDIDMFDLIKAALRQRPRVIIVGEVRGKEAYTLFQAMATGHLSYSTIHASDIQTLIQRLEGPPISLPRALLTSLDVIVFLKAIQTAEGKVERRVSSIVEIIKLDPGSQRLISVTPFTWVSPVDDRFEYNGGSHLLDKIKHDHGWTIEQLNEEFEKRKNIISWMQKNDLRSYKDVGRIISEYKKDPESILLKIKQDAV